MAPFQVIWSTGDTNFSDTLFPAPLHDSMLFVTITDGCANQLMDSALIDVQNIPLVVVPITGQVSCANDSTTIGVNVSSGYPPYSFSWFNGTSTNSTSVAVPSDTSYSVTVTDVCNRDTIVYVSVSIFPYAPLSVPNVVADSFWCPPFPVLISAPNVNGGSGNYIMSFTNWADSSSMFMAQISNDTSIVLQVVDLCTQDSLTVQYDYDFLQDSPFSVQMPQDSTICYGDSVKFEAFSSGGYPPYNYIWNTGETSPFKWVNIAGTQYYSVSVTDGCGMEILKSLTVRPKYITADFTFTTPGPLIVQLENQSNGADYFLWNFGDGNSSTFENPTHEYQVWNDYTISLFVQDSLGCVDSTTDFVRLPLEIYIPNAFSPNGDEHNKTFRIYGVWNDQLLENFSVSIFDRWGQEVFSSANINFQWDGTTNGRPVNSGVYSYIISVKFSHHDTQTRSGNVTMVR
jgi:gliding motility-associated-like protein